MKIHQQVKIIVKSICTLQIYFPDTFNLYIQATYHLMEPNSQIFKQKHQCDICTKIFNRGTRVPTFICSNNHTTCKYCFDTLKKKNGKCPFCRMTVKYDQPRVNYDIYSELPKNEIKGELANDNVTIKNKRILRNKEHNRVRLDYQPLRQNFRYENRDEIPRYPEAGRNFLNEHRVRNNRQYDRLAQNDREVQIRELEREDGGFWRRFCRRIYQMVWLNINCCCFWETLYFIVFISLQVVICLSLFLVSYAPYSPCLDTLWISVSYEKQTGAAEYSNNSNFRTLLRVCGYFYLINLLIYPLGVLIIRLFGGRWQFPPIKFFLRIISLSSSFNFVLIALVSQQTFKYCSSHQLQPYYFFVILSAIDIISAIFYFLLKIAMMDNL